MRVLREGAWHKTGQGIPLNTQASLSCWYPIFSIAPTFRIVKVEVPLDDLLCKGVDFETLRDAISQSGRSHNGIELPLA